MITLLLQISEFIVVCRLTVLKKGGADGEDG